MSNLNDKIRQFFYHFFGRHRLSAFLEDLESVARMLVFIATVALFLYAFIWPSFWIIGIIFLLFLALLAMVHC